MSQPQWGEPLESLFALGKLSKIEQAEFYGLTEDEVKMLKNIFDRVYDFCKYVIIRIYGSGHSDGHLSRTAATFRRTVRTVISASFEQPIVLIADYSAGRTEITESKTNRNIEICSKLVEIALAAASRIDVDILLSA